VGSGDAEVDEELGDGLGGHRGAAVGVQGELVAVDALAVEGVGDERFGELTGLGCGDGPGDDVAGVDVDDHEQLVVDAPFGASEFRDVPGPHLVRGPGDQLGLLAGRMGALASPFPILTDRSEEPVHGADRAQVDAVIEQLGHT
jgi:hypothetical protein